MLITPGSTTQLIIGFAFSLVILLFTSIARPFQRSGRDEFGLLCNFSLVMVLFLSLVLKMGVLSEDVEGLDLLSDDLSASYIFDPAALYVLLICTLLASVIAASFLASYQVYQSARKASRAAAAEREASIARGRLTNPPMHNWQLRQGNRYCVFLSHFKEEAGSDARYLSDLIRRKTGCAAYLDSNDLVDLRTLFNEGELTHYLATCYVTPLRVPRTRGHAHTRAGVPLSLMYGRCSQVGRSRRPRHKGRPDAAVVPARDVGGGAE